MVKIHTMVRVKPLDGNNNGIINLNLTRDELVFNEKKKSYDLQEICKQHIFNFDRVYNYNCSTDDIFNDIGIEMVDNLQKKINSTLFVFGQTGTGKTHTIIGNQKYCGFIKILLDYMIDMKIKFKVSSIELYNDNCYDIFNKNNIVHQRDDYNGNIFLAGINYLNISSKKDVQNVLTSINNNRSVGISGQNDRSSRSHLQIKIENYKGGFIKILDLAGSERASQTSALYKDNSRENAEINKSLLSLKECIRGMKNNNSYIPIRGSKLTRLLKESFTGKCNTYVLGTVSQDPKNNVDSIQTLNYISDLKYIKKIENVGLPEINFKLKKNTSEPSSFNYNNKNPYSSRNAARNVTPYSNMISSPNYKFLVRNNYKLDDINVQKKNILGNIYKKRSTKQDKKKFLNIIDMEIDFMQNLKKQLQQ